MEEIQTIIYAQTFEKGKEVMQVIEIITETIEQPKEEPIDKDEAIKRIDSLTKELESLKMILAQ